MATIRRVSEQTVTPPEMQDRNHKSAILSIFSAKHVMNSTIQENFRSEHILSTH